MQEMNAPTNVSIVRGRVHIFQMIATSKTKERKTKGIEARVETDKKEEQEREISLQGIK